MTRECNPNNNLENWDDALDRALKNLPEQSAPADLVPKVMAIIRARSRGEAQRPVWWQWPRWLRIPAAALALALIVLLPLLGIRFCETSVIPGVEHITAACRTALGSLIHATIGRLGVVSGDMFQYVLPAAILMLAVMYLISISVGTLICRTVWRYIHAIHQT